MKRIFAAAVSAGALALPTLGWAADEPVRDEDVRAHLDEEPIQAQKEMWQARFRAAREALANAQRRQREADGAYKQMRHRRRIRGEEKRRILEERSASERALEASEQALKELFESARRAGVPPGWLRMERADAPAAPEPGPPPETPADDADALP